MQALTILSQLSKAYGFSNLFSYPHEDDEGPSDIDEHGGKSDMKNGPRKQRKLVVKLAEEIYKIAVSSEETSDGVFDAVTSSIRDISAQIEADICVARKGSKKDLSTLEEALMTWQSFSLVLLHKVSLEQFQSLGTLRGRQALQVALAIADSGFMGFEATLFDCSASPHEKD